MPVYYFMSLSTLGRPQDGIRGGKVCWKTLRGIKEKGREQEWARRTSDSNSGQDLWKDIRKEGALGGKNTRSNSHSAKVTSRTMGVPKQTLLVGRVHIRQAWRRLIESSRCSGIASRAWEVWLWYEKPWWIQRCSSWRLSANSATAVSFLELRSERRPLWPVYFVLSGISLLMHKPANLLSLSSLYLLCVVCLTVFSRNTLFRKNNIC